MIRTAIVGMGIRGNLFARGLNQNPSTTLVGVCDINSQSLTSASKNWGVPGFKDFEELLKKQSPEAVIICTPDFAHYKYVITAANHGINILVEKPLATSKEEAREMMAAVQTQGVICQVAFENRWNPPFVQVKEAIKSDKLGEISVINAKLNDTLFVPTQMLKWAGKSTVGWFLLPHLVDLAIWLSGKKPSQVYAVANKKILPSLGIDTYDTICTTLRFHDDMLALFETSWILPESLPSIFDFKFDITGSRGTIHVDVQNQMMDQSTDRFSYPGTLMVDIYGKTYGFPLYMLDSFIETVKKRTEPLVTIEEGYEVTCVIEAVHRSIETGQPIVL
ncbi:MAG: Gfo/Idh/MocA family protein [Candidatus Hermodarchaeota archaeon]